MIYQLTDNNRSTTVSVIPGVGAMLHEFIINVDGKPFNIIDNYQLDRPVKEQVTDYFKSIKLSPWVCRMNSGLYQWKGASYQSEKMYKDGTALHGLLYDQPFTVEHHDGSSMQLKHEYKGYDPGYTFHFTCLVTYTLHPQNKLEVQTTIINNSETEIPIADGWHPYFKLGGKVNDWQLYFPAKAKLEFNDQLIPTGQLLPFNQFNQPALIGDTEMDNCFLLDPAAGQPACTIKNPANGLTISLLPDASYPYLQVFIPGHRESIAIENLSSAPDSFNNGMGLITLLPRHSTNFRVFYLASVEEIG